MAAFNKFQSFVEALDEGKHDFATDHLKVALCAVAPVNTNAVLGDLTEIAYTNLSSRDLTAVSSEQADGVYKLALANLALTASGGPVAPFRYVVIFNASAPANELIAWYDFGSSLALADGESLTLTFNQSQGLLQVA